MEVTFTSQKNRSRLALLVGLALAAGTLIFFWRVVGHEFIAYDDDNFIYRNPHIRDGLTWKGVRWAFTADLLFDSSYVDYWQPLTALSRLADIQIWGLNPAGHHLTNLLFHAANVVLLFSVLFRMTGRAGMSGWVAALFAVHPLQVDPVAWVTARKDLLSGFFGLLALHAYAAYVKRPGPVRFLAIASLFACSLGAKPALAALPLLLILLDYWPLGRVTIAPFHWREWFRMFSEKWVLFVISISSVLAIRFGQSGTVDVAARDLHFWDVPFFYFKYIWKTIYPVRLAIRYPPAPHLETGLLVAAWAALAGLSAFFIVQTAKKIPAVTMGWFWFLIALLPMMGLNFENRFLYWPIIGLLIMAGWGAPFLLQNWPARRFLLSLAAFVSLAVYGRVSWAELGYWHDTETLFRRAVQVSEGNYVAHNVLGAVLTAKGKMEEAVDQVTKSIWINPNYPHAHNNLASIMARQGAFDVALTHYRNAVKIDPAYLDARNNMGVILLRRGKPEEAARAFREVLKMSPEYLDARVNLGNALTEQKLFDEAVRQYEIALQYTAKAPDVHVLLGNTLALQGKPEDALRHFQEALRMEPENVDALNNAGVILSRAGKLEEAIGYFQKVLSLDPENGSAKRNLQIAQTDLTKQNTPAS